MKYIPKVWLRFKLPDGTIREGRFSQSQTLRDSLGFEAQCYIGSRLWKRKLDTSKSIGKLNLKNDDTIEVK